MVSLVRLFVGAAIAVTPVAAQSALVPFQSFVGNYGLSTDGTGSLSSSYGISAFVPVGATVTAAYLYQSNVFDAGLQTMSFNGAAQSFTSLSSTNFTTGRSDVTSIVSSVINGGAGGTYNFTVGEGNTNSTDGSALVVVYELASLGNTTVAILDGFASFEGDTTTLNFASPLDKTQPGFVADLRLGIGFSAGGQASTIDINSTRITNNAGDNDDGVLSNGALITVGGDNDPFSTLLPAYGDDRERYDIAPYITNGDTSIVIRSVNASQDDNLFLAAVRISGSAGVNAPPPMAGVPEPTTWAMMIGGFGLVGGAMRRRTTSGTTVNA